jgi:tight adherence protein C
VTGNVLLLAGLAALVGAMLLAGVIVASGPSGTVQQGLAAIENTYARRAVVAKSPDERTLPPLLVRLRALAVRLSPGTSAASLQRRLDVAGNPGHWTADRVLAFKGLGLVGLGTLGALLGSHHLLSLFGYGAVGAAAGFFLPDVLVYNAGVKRQAKIRMAVPDTLDLLTVCVEAGLGFDAALGQVARSTPGPLAGECARVLREMQFGSSRVDALRALSERTTVAGLRVLVAALVQASELGIPVARVLREQSAEMRVERRQLAEEQAQKVPVKILFPLIFCLFPALIVVIIGPGAISIAHTLLGH